MLGECRGLQVTLVGSQELLSWPVASQSQGVQARPVAARSPEGVWPLGSVGIIPAGVHFPLLKLHEMIGET